MGLFALPFILTSGSRRKMEKRLLSVLETQAQVHGTTIAEHEFGSHFALATTSDGAYAYLVKEVKDTVDVQQIPLYKVKLCRANTITRTVTNGKAKDSVIDRLELSFLYKDAKEPEQKWVLFDIEDLMQMGNEMGLMKSWEGKVNAILKLSKKPMAA